MEFYNINNRNETILIVCHINYRSISTTPNMDDFLIQKLMMNYNIALMTIDQPYSTSKNETYFNIKSLVDQQYLDKPFKFCILVGNEREIPGYIDAKENAMTDNPYAIMNFTELQQKTPNRMAFIIARMSSGEGSLEKMQKNVSVQIQKTIEYESIVGSHDWLSHVMTIGSDEGSGIGDNNEADYDHMHVIAEKFKKQSYTVKGYYDGTQMKGGKGLDGDTAGNVTAHEIRNGVNKGCGLIFYVGHASEQSWSTSGFSNNTIRNLTNNHMYPVVITVGCSAGSFDEFHLSFKEAWQVAHNDAGPTGSIVTIGSTILQQWATPMVCQDKMADVLLSNIKGTTNKTIGEIFHEGLVTMIDKYGRNGEYEARFWHFFGDPTVRLKTSQQTTEPLDIIHSYPNNNQPIIKSLKQKVVLMLNKPIQSITKEISLTTRNKPTIAINSTMIIRDNIITLLFNTVDLSHLSNRQSPMIVPFNLDKYVETPESVQFIFELRIDSSLQTNPIEDKSIEANLSEDNLTEDNLNEDNLTEDNEDKSIEANLNEDNLTEDNLNEDNSIEANLSEDNLTEDNLSEDNLTEDNLNEDMSTEDNLSEDNFIEIYPNEDKSNEVNHNKNNLNKNNTIVNDPIKIDSNPTFSESIHTLEHHKKYKNNKVVFDTRVGVFIALIVVVFMFRKYWKK